MPSAHTNRPAVRTSHPRRSRPGEDRAAHPVHPAAISAPISEATSPTRSWRTHRPSFARSTPQRRLPAPGKPRQPRSGHESAAVEASLPDASSERRSPPYRRPFQRDLSCPHWHARPSCGPNGDHCLLPRQAAKGDTASGWRRPPKGADSSWRREAIEPLAAQVTGVIDYLALSELVHRVVQALQRRADIRRSHRSAGPVRSSPRVAPLAARRPWPATTARPARPAARQPVLAPPARPTRWWPGRRGLTVRLAAAAGGPPGRSVGAGPVAVASAPGPNNSLSASRTVGP